MQIKDVIMGTSNYLGYTFLSNRENQNGQIGYDYVIITMTTEGQGFAIIQLINI